MMDTLRELAYWGQAVMIPVLGVFLLFLSLVLGTREK